MEFIVWLIFGAIAGWLASMIMKTNGSQGALANIATGVVGALIGGYLARFLGFAGVTGFNLPSLITAVIGAVILIAILQAIRKK